MLGRDDLDVVVICTPHPGHPSETIAAADAGKHIVIEKPVAMDRKSLEKMLAAVESNGVTTSVCFELRWIGLFQNIKALVKQGLLGKLFYGETGYFHGIGPWYGQYPWNRKKDMGGDAFLTAGCHALDGLIWLMGSDVVEVSAMSNTSPRNPLKYEYDTNICAILRFENGAIGKVATSIECRQPYSFPVLLQGDKGSIDGDKVSTTLWPGTSAGEWARIPTAMPDSGDVDDHPYLGQLEYFVDCVRRKKRPHNDLKACSHVHEVMFAIQDALAKRKTVAVRTTPGALSMKLSRRRFLAGAASLAATPLAFGQDVGADHSERASSAPRTLPKRKLGRTGLEVGILTLGTHPLGTLPDSKENEALRIIEAAFEAGVNYFDTAPSYARHRAERRIGKALRGKRDKVLIGTKSYQMPKEAALRELDASLEALGTDHVDLFQIHSLQSPADLERKLDDEKGVLAAALEAKKQGKCRFIGVTGHVHPEVMATALARFDFDTILVPINAADPLWRSFIDITLPVAKKKGTGVIAMKAFAAGRLVRDVKGQREREQRMQDCLRFVLSQDIATASVGAKSLRELMVDLRAAKSFEPMPKDEQSALTRLYAPHPGRSLEWYKRELG